MKEDLRRCTTWMKQTNVFGNGDYSPRYLIHINWIGKSGGYEQIILLQLHCILMNIFPKHGLSPSSKWEKVKQGVLISIFAILAKWRVLLEFDENVFKGKSEPVFGGTSTKTFSFQVLRIIVEIPIYSRLQHASHRDCSTFQFVATIDSTPSYQNNPFWCFTRYQIENPIPSPLPPSPHSTPKRIFTFHTIFVSPVHFAYSYFHINPYESSNHFFPVSLLQMVSSRIQNAFQ